MLPVLLLVTLLAAQGLNADVIWYDELTSIGHAGGLTGPFSPLDVLHSINTHSPKHGPLFFELLAGWGALVGWHHAVLRCLTALFWRIDGCLGIPHWQGFSRLARGAVGRRFPGLKRILAGIFPRNPHVHRAVGHACCDALALPAYRTVKVFDTQASLVRADPYGIFVALRSAFFILRFPGNRLLSPGFRSQDKALDTDSCGVFDCRHIVSAMVASDLPRLDNKV